jgi:hypothetical protein
MKFIINKYLLVVVTILFCISCNKQLNESKKPNIILIYADDLGIGLLGHEGQKIIKTPNIDQLAKDGMRFQQAYSNMLCAPARASLISGLHDSHKNKFQINRGGQYKKATKANIDSIKNKINKKLRQPNKEQVFFRNSCTKKWL